MICIQVRALDKRSRGGARTPGELQLGTCAVRGPASRGQQSPSSRCPWIFTPAEGRGPLPRSGTFFPHPSTKVSPPPTPSLSPGAVRGASSGRQGLCPRHDCSPILVFPGLRGVEGPVLTCGPWGGGPQGLLGGSAVPLRSVVGCPLPPSLWAARSTVGRQGLLRPWGPLHPRSGESGRTHRWGLGRHGGALAPAVPRCVCAHAVSVLSDRGGAEARNVREPPHQQHEPPPHAQARSQSPGRSVAQGNGSDLGADQG